MTTIAGHRRTTSAAILLLLALAGCANRDIGRAKEAVPHQPPPTPAAPASATPPTPPNPPTPPTQPVAPVKPVQPAPTPPSPPKPSAPAQATGLREVFPHVRVDAANKVVEFDAVVPLNAKDPEKPRIYLEVIACPPDTKEHEAVLLTQAKPSQVHAALLLIGLEPGTPGRWNWEGEKLETIPPTGPRVTVTASYERDGRTIEVSPSKWVLDVNTGKTLDELEPEATWLFAGSQMIPRQGQETYRADSDGTLIGLHTFGGECLAWPRMYNPDSGIEEPHWIANAATLPPYNTPVIVRLRPASASPPAAKP